MKNSKNNEVNTLRKNAQKAFFEGVNAANPEAALSKSLIANPIPIISDEGRYVIISIGKAACKMANCFLNVLPKDAKFSALAVTNFENMIAVEGCVNNSVNRLSIYGIIGNNRDSHDFYTQ